MELYKTLSTIQPNFDWMEVVVNLSITAVLSFIVAGVYMITHKRQGYEQDLIQTFIFLSMVVSSIMLVIGNNLAGAFGLVGAVSIIRFRTKVDNPQDTAYIFFVVAVGLSCGLKQYTVAIIATLFISIVLIVFWRSNFAKTNPSGNENVLSVRMTDVIPGRKLIEETFKDDIEAWDIIGIHAVDESKVIIDYKVKLKKDSTSQNFVNKIFNTVNGQLVILRYEAI